MAFFNPLRTPKHQRYKYIPRYWEPEKEELQERIRQATPGQNNDPNDMKGRIARGFARRANLRNNTAASNYRKSAFRLLIIIAILLVVTFVLLAKFLPIIEKALE